MYYDSLSPFNDFLYNMYVTLTELNIYQHFVCFDVYTFYTIVINFSLGFFRLKFLTLNGDSTLIPLLNLLKFQLFFNIKNLVNHPCVHK